MQEKVTRAKLNTIAKKYEIDYSSKKMDQLCKELVKKGEKLVCVSPRVVLRGNTSDSDDDVIKSNKTKSSKTISKKSKSVKKAPKTQSIKKSPNPKEEKINRKELIEIAKEYKISHSKKRMDVICEELVQKGAPLKCKSPKIILRLSRELSPKKASPKKESPKKASPKKASPKKTSPKKESPKKTSPKKILPKKSQKKTTKKPSKEKISDTQMKPIKLKDNETLDNIECVAIDQKIANGKEISRVENIKDTKSYNMAKSWLDFFQDYSYINITANIKVVEKKEHSKLVKYRHKTLYSKGEIVDDFEDF